VKIPAAPPATRGDRTECRWFSHKSRRKLLGIVNSIDQGKTLPQEFLFFTLTYNLEYPAARATKRHLDMFVKRMERAYGHRWLLWKLEPQKRGAPHYHLLVYWPSIDNCGYLALLDWVARAWHDIAGEGNPDHLKVHQGEMGNRPCVEAVMCWKAVACYVGKYMGKEVRGDEEWQHPGRYWGQRRSELAPCTILQENVSARVAVKLRRLCVRHFEHECSGVVHFSGKRTPGGVDLPGFNLRREHKVEGKPVAAIWQSLGEDLGRKVTWKRRRWPTSRGGFSGFIDYHTFQRYLKLARELCCVEGNENCNRSNCNEKACSGVGFSVG